MLEYLQVIVVLLKNRTRDKQIISYVKVNSNMNNNFLVKYQRYYASLQMI